MKMNRSHLVTQRFDVERALRAVNNSVMHTVDFSVVDSINDHMWIHVSGSIWDIVVGSIERRVDFAVESEFKILRRRSK